MADAPNTPAPPAPPATPPAAPPAPKTPDPAVERAEVDEAAGRTPAPVPYDRFRAVMSERREAAKQVELLTAATAEKDKRIAELEAQVGTMRTETRRATARAETGIEDPADLGVLIDAYDRVHEKVDEKKRPTLADWKKDLAADEAKAAAAGLPTSWRRAYLAPATDAKAPAGRAPAGATVPDRSKGTTAPKEKTYAEMSPEERMNVRRGFGSLGGF